MRGGERREEGESLSFYFFPSFLGGGRRGECYQRSRGSSPFTTHPTPPKVLGRISSCVLVQCSVKQRGGVCKCLWTSNFGATEPKVCSPPRPALSLGWEHGVCKLSRSGSGGRPERSPALFRQTKVIAQSVAVPLRQRRAQAGDADAALESRERRGNFWPAVLRMGRSGGCSGWFYP